jgi:hypothetical protein
MRHGGRPNEHLRSCIHDDAAGLKGRLRAALHFFVSGIAWRRYILMMSQPDFQPTLVGPSITVRPISKDDWTEMFAAGCDPHGDMPYFIFEITKDRYQQGGRALVA